MRSVILKMKYFKIISVIILSATIAACSLFAPWKKIEIEETKLPWCGPGKHVVEERQEYDMPISPTGSVVEYRWVTSFWQKEDIYTYAEKIDSYLKEISVVDHSQESQAWADGINQRVAPYKFTFISVHPLIVIMRPYDFGPQENRSISEIVGSRGSFALQSRFLMNYYEYGTEIPFQTDLLWFSPDLNIKPQKIDLKINGKQDISWSGESLVLIEKDGVVKTERVLKR